MKITPENFEKYTILTVEGRVDATTAETFYTQTAEFLEKDNKPLILDFSNLEYISSAGLRSVLKIAKNCQTKHLFFACFALQKPVADVFKFSGFNTIIKIFADKDSAIASLTC